MDKPARDEKIELYGRGFDLLTAALSELPREMWQFKPAPSEWSVHQVLIHLADSETNAAMRLRMLIVQPGGSLMAYDQDRWADTLDYHDQDIQDALDTLRLVRKTTHALLKKQPEAVFEHSVHHPEYAEPYSFDNWLEIYSAHIPGHIEQIRSNYRLWRDRQG